MVRGAGSHHGFLQVRRAFVGLGNVVTGTLGAPVAALAGVTAWMGAYLLDWSTWRRLPRMRRADALAFLVTALGVQVSNAIVAVSLGIAIHFTPAAVSYLRAHRLTPLAHPESAGQRG